MSSKNTVHVLEYQFIDAATLNGTYQAINPAGFDHPCWLVRIVNDSGKIVHISYDGDTNNDVIPANGFLDVYSQTNGQPNNFVALFPRGQIIYAAITGMASTGDVYVTGYYNPLNN
jgi:hypothetical protein